ncbi:uncharacterized protein LOC110863372 isoform X2 [Folsomia candida]|uniref:uncharacterized protein LOC110863372 isoform X2 n=1 Tax=Folsomia candida TaxID=158441 RepID=UPI001604E15D|nr:uncharacterized protein LOC110863372 isoform X2 [Folsomia candida]
MNQQIPPEHSERQHDVITVDSNDEESLQQSEDSCMLQNEGSDKIHKFKKLCLRPSRQGYTALHEAAQNSNPALIKTLLKSGMRPDAQDCYGNSPLHLVARKETDEALECARLLLQHSPNLTGKLNNMLNMEGHTALHRSFKEGLKEMVKLFLNRRYKLDLDELIGAKIENIFLQHCRSKISCEIMKLIVSACTQLQLNKRDEDGRTLLHFAAMERLPEITEILVADDRVDIAKVDKSQRTALHYAAENGSYPSGCLCVEHLISRKFPKMKWKLYYLYDMEDMNGISSFRYALKNCGVETLQKFLAATPQPHRWMTTKKMSVIYKQCPLAIKALMDRGFSQSKPSMSSKIDEIVIDFGPITGYVDPLSRKPIPQLETQYIKHAHRWDYSAQREILQHPLVQIFIAKKCQKLRVIFSLWIVRQIIWLASFQLLLLTTYCNALNSPKTQYCSATVMTIHITCTLLYHALNVVTHKWKYFYNVTNFVKLTEAGLASVALHPVLMGSEVFVEARNCAAIGIIFSHILFMRGLGNVYDEIGLIVEVLKQVFIQTVKVLLACSPLLIGFTYAFVVLFDNVDTLTATFPGQFEKVFVMMIGDLEYSDLFNKKSEEGGTTQKNNRIMQFLLLMSFLICVTIAYFNLLTGFALERVMELRERSNVDRIAKKVKHIHRMDSVLRNICLFSKLVDGEYLKNVIRRHNVTTKRVGESLQFEAFFTDASLGLGEGKIRKQKGSKFFKRMGSPCATELSEHVTQDIFALLSKHRS